MKAHLTTVMLLSAIGLGGSLPAQEFEQAPILYGKAAPQNRFSQLVERIQSGETSLEYDPRSGYLRSLLDTLGISTSSQTLVFSKTSLQRQRISPRTPRALYFADDLYVGYCQHGEVLEVSAVDPELGAVFYTVSQTERDRPQISRQSDNCLICHASSQTKEVPGHLVRSLFVDNAGMPILSAGSHRVNQTTPFANRWGGWYVTGTHGRQTHLGNLVIDGENVPSHVDNAKGLNVTDLRDRFDTTAYLSPHSDLVALMVLEHQTDLHNLITRAGFGTRQAMHYQQTLNRELSEPADHEWDSTKTRIRSACDPLVEYMLFSGEARLDHPVRGTSGFDEQFVRTGPRDRRGRSLRELDLETRLFKYPCSYLIYSPSFQALPREAKDYVLERLRRVLMGEDTSGRFAHLTPDDRQAILEIVRDTMPDLPASWQQPD